jgi:anti-anti-sigma factor
MCVGGGSSRRSDGTWVIELIGEHDLSTVPMLAEWTSQIDDDSAQLIEIDLRRAEFIDSTVIGTLVRLDADLARAGRELVIVSPLGTFPRRVLDLVRAPSMLRVIEGPQTDPHALHRHQETLSCP